VTAAATIAGSDMDIGGEVAWVHTFAPIDGVADVPALPVREGRAPRTDREIAVGGVTLREIDREIGDTVTVTSIARGESYEMEIVGEAIMNDTFEASPGRGGSVTPEFIAEAAPEVANDPMIIELAAGADADAVAEELQALYDGLVQGPVPQVALRNVDRIRYLPSVMAGVVVVLAIASLVHALLLSVGRNRRPFGVLKAIGFTRSQVFGTVACQATAFALVAVVVAVPVGVFLGRQGWELVAEGLGVPVVPVVPVMPVVAVVVGALVVANVIAVYPALRAAHLRTAAALRSE
jgi:putative ABC transport system permease protein